MTIDPELEPERQESARTTPSSSNRRRVLVIGGQGFVGRALVERFAAAGDEVVVAGRRHRPDRDHLHLDLVSDSPTTVARKIARARVDVVVNTVGSIWGRADDEMWSAATWPTNNLVAALESLRERPTLVHLGSVLEYGRVAPGTVVGPRTPPHPDTAYGRAKLAATRVVLEADRRDSIQAVVLRLANVCGPGTPPISLLGRVASALADARRRGTPAQVRLTPMRASRDYIDVRDVADAVLLATRADVRGRILDIGRGEAVAVRHLVELLIEVSGVPAYLVEHGSRPALTESLQVDLGPASAALGWIPHRTLLTAIRDLWAEVDIARETDLPGDGRSENSPRGARDFATTPASVGPA